MLLLDRYRDAIAALCTDHHVSRLYAFGSAVNGTFSDHSDVDLIVDFKGIALDTYADNYFDLKFRLQRLLGRPVDLLEEQAIHNPYFKQAVLQQRTLIYEC